MRSEAEIRKQVETRLRRWGLLALNGILWVGAAKLIYAYSQTAGFFGRDSDVIVLIMLAWIILVGLHTLRTIYVELRERLVQRAIEQERQRYQQGTYEKRKHDEAPSLLDEVQRALEGDDGELIDFPFSQEPEVKANYE